MVFTIATITKSLNNLFNCVLLCWMLEKWWCGGRCAVFNLFIILFICSSVYNCLCTAGCMLMYRCKHVMQGKLFQKCTHLFYCSVLSLGGNVNTRRMSKPDMGSIFHIKKSIKYSAGKRNYDVNYQNYQNEMLLSS